jgi:Ca2+-transporting ATPase
MYALCPLEREFTLPLQTFTCFVFLDLVSAIQSRALGCAITQNKMLVSAVSVSFIVQLGLVYVPLMQRIFQTAALDSEDLLLLLFLAGISFTLHEVRRSYERGLNAAATSMNLIEDMT